MNNNCASRPLLASGRWKVEPSAKCRKANNGGHLEAGASHHCRYEYSYSHTDQRLRGDAVQEGPFVFGFHNPDQFPLRSRFAAAEDDDKSVIDESRSLYCDRKISVKPAAQTFKIKDKKKKADAAKRNIKCVLVGDGAVGKTSLITSYAQNLFQYDYRPTTFDKYDVKVEVDSKPICVQICDTAGQDYLEGMRELCYPGSDVIMLCFSVVKPESFRSIANRWVPGVASVKAPYILIGTQCDLRDDFRVVNDLKLQGENPISESDARLLASKLNAPYIETSSKTRNRLKDAFDSAILAAMPYKKKKSIWKQIFCLS